MDANTPNSLVHEFFVHGRHEKHGKGNAVLFRVFRVFRGPSLTNFCPRKARKNTKGRTVFFFVSFVFSVDPLFFIRVDSCLPSWF